MKRRARPGSSRCRSWRRGASPPTRSPTTSCRSREERHGYLAFAPLFLGLLGALALVGVVRRGRDASPLAFARLPPLAFVVQEHAERLELVVTEPAFLVGLAAPAAVRARGSRGRPRVRRRSPTSCCEALAARPAALRAPVALRAPRRARRRASPLRLWPARAPPARRRRSPEPRPSTSRREDHHEQAVDRRGGHRRRRRALRRPATGRRRSSSNPPPPPPPTTHETDGSPIPAAATPAAAEAAGGRACRSSFAAAGRSAGFAASRWRRTGRVVLVVRADVADHVHLHGYDVMRDVAPGKPGRLDVPRHDPRPLRGRARGCRACRSPT